MTEKMEPMLMLMFAYCANFALEHVNPESKDSNGESIDRRLILAEDHRGYHRETVGEFKHAGDDAEDLQICCVKIAEYYNHPHAINPPVGFRIYDLASKELLAEGKTERNSENSLVATLIRH